MSGIRICNLWTEWLGGSTVIYIIKTKLEESWKTKVIHEDMQDKLEDYFIYAKFGDRF